MNLAYRDVRHNLFRFLLTCLGLSLLMAVVLAMIGIYNGLVADALNIVKAPQVDLWVVESGTQGPFAEASKIPGGTRDAVARLHGVAEAGSITYQTVEARHAGDTLRLYVIGYESGHPGGPQRIAEGRGITQTHFELVADRKTGLAVSDRIRLGRDTLCGRRTGRRCDEFRRRSGGLHYPGGCADPAIATGPAGRTGSGCTRRRPAGKR